jgi:hypothetical protein
VANPLTSQQSEPDVQHSRSAQLARRLLVHDTPAGTTDPELIAVGLRKTCARIAGNLRNALGADATNALLVRALTRIEAQHPRIVDLRRSSEGNISFDALVKSVDEQGVAHVSAAIEALLVALIDILVRLIGEDMTVRLVAGDAAPQSSANGGGSAS